MSDILSDLLNDASGMDDKTKEFLNAILGGQTCGGCQAKGKDLRPWPPDNPTAPKFCGECRLKKALGK